MHALPPQPSASRVVTVDPPAEPSAMKAEFRRLRAASAEWIAEQADPIIALSLRLYTTSAFVPVNRWLRLAASHAVPGSPIELEARSLWKQQIDVPPNERKKMTTIWGHIREPRSVLQWFAEEYKDPLWRPTVGFVVRGLRRALRWAPQVEVPLELYRGIQPYYGSTALQWSTASLESGASVHMTEHALLSTTTKPDIATSKAQGGCCLIIVHVPVGTRVLNLKSISRYPNEDEFLLGPHLFLLTRTVSQPQDVVVFGYQTPQRRPSSAASFSSFSFSSSSSSSHSSSSSPVGVSAAGIEPSSTLSPRRYEYQGVAYVAEVKL